MSEALPSTSPRSHRPVRRSVLLPTAGLIAAACLVATSGLSGVAGGVGTGRAVAATTACTEQAARMGTPYRYTAPRRRVAVPTPYTHRADPPGYPAAERAADAARRAGNTAQASRLQRIATTPRAVWFVDQSLTGAALTRAVATAVTDARKRVKTVTLVTYTIPLRDCDGHSSGSPMTGPQYVSWTQAFAAGVRQGLAGQARPGVAVILEPDALGLIGDLPTERRQERYDLLRQAVDRYTAIAGVGVYLDGGHSNWHSSATAASRLSAAGVAGARGFALNVSNFRTTTAEVGYGLDLSARLGGKTFVVDTSRNGRGPSGSEWCNPRGRALGAVAQARPRPTVDAYLWIKAPGESDGSCAPGQPAAGVFWTTIADEMARNAGY